MIMNDELGSIKKAFVVPSQKILVKLMNTTNIFGIIGLAAKNS
jgi:hypothetical protein